MSFDSRMELAPLKTDQEIVERSPFGTVITAMITPFDFRADVSDRLQSLKVANFLQESGSEGLVIAGTTGESSALSSGDQVRLVRDIVDNVNIPVLAGTGANTTKEAVQLTEQASKIEELSGLLVVSPYYNRPPQAGIIDYYERVADAADGKPVIMYDIPARTGRAVDTETILKLASGVDNIVGIKIASGDPGQTAEIKRENPDFLVYSGDDALNLRHFGAGADGAISVVSHWAPRLIKQMWEAKQLPSFKDGGRARAIDNILQESYEFASSDEAPNPLPAKAVMRKTIGKSIGYCKSPMSPQIPDLNFEGRLETCYTGVRIRLMENIAKLQEQDI
ncbi:MAG: 4-hydroxy-tetrahydrodipicolinate synthase [Patescibacteria group bacterium]